MFIYCYLLPQEKARVSESVFFFASRWSRDIAVEFFFQFVVEICVILLDTLKTAVSLPVDYSLCCTSIVTWGIIPTGGYAIFLTRFVQIPRVTPKTSELPCFSLSIT